MSELRFDVNENDIKEQAIKELLSDKEIQKALKKIGDDFLDKDVKQYTFNFSLVEAMKVEIENLLIYLNRYEDVYFYKLNTKGIGEIYFADLKKPSIVIGHHSVIFTPYADYLLAEDMVTFIKIFTKKVYRDYINITYCDDFFKEVN